MDSRALLLQAYQVKQHLDHSPGYEAQAVYLLLSVLISAVLYAILIPFNLFESLVLVWGHLKNFLESNNHTSNKSSMPGTFPSDQSVDSTMNKPVRISTKNPSPAPSSIFSSTENDMESADSQKHLLIHLRQELYAAKAQVEKAKAYVLLHLDAIIREEAIAVELQATQAKLDEAKMLLAGQYCSPQQKTGKHLDEMNKKLEQSEDRVAHLLENEVELTEKIEALQVKLDKVSNRLKAAQSANVEASMKIADLEKQHQQCLSESLTEAQRDSFTLGTAIRRFKAEYDNGMRQKDDQLRHKDEELKSLYTAYRNQIWDDRNTYEQNYAKLVAENARLRAEVYVETGVMPQDKNQISDLQVTTSEQDQTIQRQSMQMTHLLEENSRKETIILGLEEEKAAAAKIKEESNIINNERIDIQNRMEMMRCHMQSEIDSMRNSNLKQQAQLGRLETEKDDSIAQLEEAQQKVVQLETQLGDKMDADPGSKETYEQEMKQLNSDIQRMSSELSNLKALNSTPSANLQRTVTTLQKEVRQERLERAKAQGRFEQNLARLVEANKKVDQLQKAANSADTTSTALQIKLTDQETILKDQTHQLLTPNHEITSLKSTTSAQATTIAILTTRLSTLTDQNSNLQYLLTQHLTEISDQNSTIVDLENQLQSRSNHVVGVQTAFETTRQMHESKIKGLQLQLDQSRNGSNSNQTPNPAPATNTATTTTSKKRDLDSDDDIATNTVPVPAPVDGSMFHFSSPHPDSDTPAHASASTPVQPPPASKRPSTTAATAEKSSLDWELFEGPLPDLEAMVVQDLENERREREEMEREEAAKVEEEQVMHERMYE